MKKVSLHLIFCFGLIGIVNAQNEGDALRFSQKFYEADPTCTGGVTGAGPLSSNVNPAAFALKKKSEVFIIGSFSNTRTNSSYLGESNTDGKYNFVISGIGVTLNGNNDEYDDFGYTIGFSFNQTNSFHQRIFFEGINTESTILETFAEDASGTIPDNLSMITFGGLAYEAYLIDPASIFVDEDQYVPALSNLQSIRVLQGRVTETEGSINDLNVSFAVRHRNILYGGISIGITTLGYTERSEFFEENLADTVRYYESMSFVEDIRSDAVGVTVILGIIYQPITGLRFGGSVQTPSAYSFNENYRYDMFGQIKGRGEEWSWAYGHFDYKLTTPLRATLSAAWAHESYGSVSIDYEFVDYRTARFSSSWYGYIDENVNIQSMYRSVGNLRIGAEGRLRMFSVRGGYAHYSSPFKSKYLPENVDGSSSAISLGIGIHTDAFSVDLTYIRRQAESFYVPYSVKGKTIPGAVSDMEKDIVQIGFRKYF